MAETKITIAMTLDMIEEIATGTPNEETILAYCANEKAKLENKRVKAKERADAKRAAGDELQAVVLATLTDVPQTRDEILAQIDGEDLTVGKIQAKLNNLVKFEQASKCTVKTEEGKTKTAYTVYCAE